jgi:two-component system, OmpR family, sensor kinase
MALVLAAFGAFLYLRFDRDLDASLDRGLRSRADDVAALVRRADSQPTRGRRKPLIEDGESFAQALDARGRVVTGTPQLRGRPVIGPAELRRARRQTITIDRGGPIDTDERTRLLATPVRAGDERFVVVVGASLDDNEESLRNLLVLLLIGGPVALLLASAAGYGLAAAALRPVDAMRRRAAEIHDSQPGRRLPVASADDEISRLGDTLNAMLGRLEEAFERERTFVSDASHELRTPLAILKAELELALRAGRSREELAAALRSAAEETDRLAQLAEDLLVIARSDRGALPVRLSSIEAAELLNDVRARYAGRADEQGRSVEVTAPPDLELTADRLRLQQALGNVLDNALRHGGGTVRLVALEDDGSVELHVSDEGDGFPEGFLDHAFERFTRGDDGRSRGGSGLGLAIVEAIARAHHGRAAAANLDGGADVWIELPTTGG